MLKCHKHWSRTTWLYRFVQIKGLYRRTAYTLHPKSLQTELSCCRFEIECARVTEIGLTLTPFHAVHWQSKYDKFVLVYRANAHGSRIPGDRKILMTHILCTAYANTSKVVRSVAWRKCYWGWESLHQPREMERADKELWVIENIKSNLKSFF